MDIHAAKRADDRFLRVLVLLGVWTLVCGAATFAMMLPTWRGWVMRAVSLLSFATMLSIYWVMTGRMQLAESSGRIDKLMNAITGIFVSGVFTIVSVIGLGVMPMMVKYYSVMEYKKELDAYTSSEDGFKYINKIAREKFKVNLVLADATIGWMDTQIESPMRSPASVHVGPGICELRVLPSGIYNELDGDKELKRAWAQGVQVHEIGHCLDINRDLDQNNELKSDARSIAPGERAAKNIVQAWKSMDSRRWREIYADLIAVGFWKIEHPKRFVRLFDELEKKRNNSKRNNSGDKVHDSSCWLKFAKTNGYPEKLEDLPAWSDEVRSSAPCKLNT